MSKKVKYEAVVIEVFDTSTLQDKINECLKDDYMIVGTLSVTAHGEKTFQYIQIMQKEIKDNK